MNVSQLISLTEMARIDLKGAEEFLLAKDWEKVAEVYVKNMKNAKKDVSSIIKSLGPTFKTTLSDGNVHITKDIIITKEEANELKQAIKDELHFTPRKKPLEESEKTAEDIYEKGEENLDELIKADKTGNYIYYAGRDWEEFDFKKGLDALIKKDKTGFYIYDAGCYWKEFDFEKGFNALIKVNKVGYIYHAGFYWDQFDYKKGLDVLIKKDKEGEYIYRAGKFWKQFDYKKGLEALKGTEYHKRALKSWPKGAEMSKIVTSELQKKSVKLKKKTLSLKESEDTMLDIYRRKDLDALFKEDKDGRFIYKAGLVWKNFDFKRGLDELIKRKYAWTYILWAGREWDHFDYKKGLNALKGTKLYRRALEEWPLGTKETKEAMHDLQKNSIKLKKKTLKLEEFGGTNQSSVTKNSKAYKKSKKKFKKNLLAMDYEKTLKKEL